MRGVRDESRAVMVVETGVECRVYGLGFRGSGVGFRGHCPVFLGGGTQGKKMSKGHLPRVVYHQVYNAY